MAVRKPSARLAEAVPDTRPIVDVPRESVDPEELEGSEAAGTTATSAEPELKLRGRTYPMPRLGPMAPIIFLARQQAYSEALEKRGRLMANGFNDDVATRESGVRDASIKMFTILVTILGSCIPEEMLVALSMEEIGDLVTQITPFVLGGLSGSQSG